MQSNHPNYIFLWAIFWFPIFFFYFLQTEGNGDPDEVHLDDEMEKVFAGTEKFTVAQFSDDADPKTDNRKLTIQHATHK